MSKRNRFCILDQESLLRMARRTIFVEASYRLTKLSWEQDNDFKKSGIGRILNVAEFLTGEGSLTPGVATVEVGDPFSNPAFARDFQFNAQSMVNDIIAEVKKGPATTEKYLRKIDMRYKQSWAGIRAYVSQANEINRDAVAHTESRIVRQAGILMGSKVFLSAATLGGGSIGIALTSLAGKYAIEIAGALQDMSAADGLLIARDASTDLRQEALTRTLETGSDFYIANARTSANMSKAFTEEAARMHHNAQVYRGVSKTMFQQGNTGTGGITALAAQKSIKGAGTNIGLARESVDKAQKSLRTGTLLGKSAKVLSVAFVFKDSYDAAKEFSDTVNSLNN